MASAVLFFALLLALVLPGAAFAGYAQVVPPPAFQSVGGVSTINVGNAANGARYVGGHVVTSGTLNLGARIVTVPVAFRVAANAATFAVTRMNPWVAGASLAVSAVPLVRQWITGTNLEVTDAGALQRRGSPGANVDQDQTLLADGRTLRRAVSDAGGEGSFYPPVTFLVGFIGASPAVHLRDGLWNIQRSWPLGPGGAVPLQPTPGGPATIADLDALGTKPINPAVLPLLDIPVPVDPVPVINPATQPTGDVVVGPTTNPAPQLQPSPIRFPDGDPVPIPNSTPQRYTQPWQEVVPSPTPTQPWRVDVRPITTIVDSPVPAPDPTPNPTPNPSPNPAPVPNFYTDCDKYPGSLGCMPVGSEPPSVDVPKRSLDLTLQSGPSFSGGGCPANLTFNIHGQSLTGINMATPCAWITSYVRPVILLLAAISAVFIILPRSD